MKTLYLFLIASLAGVTTTYSQVKLTGLLRGLTADSISFNYSIRGINHQDRVAVKLESFIWQSTIDSPILVKVILPFHLDNLEYPFFVEPGEMKLSGSLEAIDSLINISITGSKTESLFLNYINQRMHLQMEIQDIERRMVSISPDSTSILRKNMANLEEEVKSGLAVKEIKANPQSFFSIYLLGQLIQSTRDYNLLKKLFENLAPQLKTSYAGLSTMKELDLLQLSAKGQQLKAFHIAADNGKLVSLSDYKGKILLVDFWASWCTPCRNENPNVLKNYHKYHDLGFDVLSISCDSNIESWKKAIREDKLPWKQLREWSILKYYDLKSIPSNILVDGSGKILAVNLMGEVLTKKLDDIFSNKK